MKISTKKTAWKPYSDPLRQNIRNATEKAIRDDLSQKKAYTTLPICDIVWIFISFTYAFSKKPQP